MASATDSTLNEYAGGKRKYAIDRTLSAPLNKPGPKPQYKGEHN